MTSSLIAALFIATVTLCLPAVVMDQINISKVVQHDDIKLEITCIANHHDYCSDKPDNFRFNDGCRKCKCVSKNALWLSEECTHFVNFKVKPEVYCQKILIENLKQLNKVKSIGYSKAAETEPAPVDLPTDGTESPILSTSLPPEAKKENASNVKNVAFTMILKETENITPSPAPTSVNSTAGEDIVIANTAHRVIAAIHHSIIPEPYPHSYRNQRLSQAALRREHDRPHSKQFPSNSYIDPHRDFQGGKSQEKQKSRGNREDQTRVIFQVDRILPKMIDDLEETQPANNDKYIRRWVRQNDPYLRQLQLNQQSSSNKIIAATPIGRRILNNEQSQHEEGVRAFNSHSHLDPHMQFQFAHPLPKTPRLNLDSFVKIDLGNHSKIRISDESVWKYLKNRFSKVFAKQPTKSAPPKPELTKASVMATMGNLASAFSRFLDQRNAEDSDNTANDLKIVQSGSHSTGHKEKQTKGGVHARFFTAYGDIMGDSLNDILPNNIPRLAKGVFMQVTNGTEFNAQDADPTDSKTSKTRDDEIQNNVEHASITTRGPVLFRPSLQFLVKAKLISPMLQKEDRDRIAYSDSKATNIILPVKSRRPINVQDVEYTQSETTEKEIKLAFIHGKIKELEEEIEFLTGRLKVCSAYRKKMRGALNQMVN